MDLDAPVAPQERVPRVALNVDEAGGEQALDAHLAAGSPPEYLGASPVAMTKLAQRLGSRGERRCGGHSELKYRSSSHGDT